MTLLRTRLGAAVAVTAAVAAGAPAASASIAPIGYFSAPGAIAGFPGVPNGALATPVSLAANPCVTATNQGQGRTGGVAIQSCGGTGLTFIGPSSAVSTVIGPTIIAAAYTGTVITAGGNVAIGP
ncbi:MAG TPA: hypothetical protein VG365_10935 [Solirubrobacteraceae bacterium]|jgi:hypothetical protein|nr:hypothetical protein [Solirubrobacteraceae bacterium]